MIEILYWILHLLFRIMYIFWDISQIFSYCDLIDYIPVLDHFCPIIFWGHMRQIQPFKRELNVVRFLSVQTSELMLICQRRWHISYCKRTSKHNCPLSAWIMQSSWIHKLAGTSVITYHFLEELEQYFSMQLRLVTAWDYGVRS